MDHRPNCDILIVGAGSAGCVLARQLVQKRGLRVTLIEPPSRQDSAVNQLRPANWIRMLGGVEDWNLATHPETQLAGRKLAWPRGRGLGGSSRINAMIWFAPTPNDLQRWQSASGGKWNATRLQQSFAEVQDLVRPESPAWISESSRRFLEATKDEHDAHPMAYQRINRDGRRWNPASLLDELQDDDRLKIVRASVDRIEFENNRAVGVVVETGETIRCTQQVVLSAGAIATPCILMRSGIGPRNTLREHRIESRIDLPGVGENLRDHLIMPIVFGIRSHERFPTRSTMREIAKWQTLGSGPLASNLAECGGLFAGGKVQIHVTPTHYLTHPSERARAAMTMGVNATDPKSAGRVMLSSSCHEEPPRIQPNYLADPDDLATTIDGARLAREISRHATLASWVTDELLPGSKRENDDAIAQAIARYAQTLYHPIGTCAMGIGNQDVVDSNLTVRGLENVSVVDASVLPSLTSGNPSASVMTIANWFACELFSV